MVEAVDMAEAVVAVESFITPHILLQQVLNTTLLLVLVGLVLAIPMQEITVLIQYLM